MSEAVKKPLEAVQLPLTRTTMNDDGTKLKFVVEDLQYEYEMQTDKLTNQKTAPYRPCGWGKSMLEALSECVRAIERFPYEESASAGG